MHKVFYLASDEFIRHDLNSTEVEKELYEKKKKIRVIFYREKKRRFIYNTEYKLYAFKKKKKKRISV